MKFFAFNEHISNYFDNQGEKNICLFWKKNDKVSSNFHPFSIYCYGLIFTLLLMAPPEDPAGSSLVTASVPPEYDPDLDPG